MLTICAWCGKHLLGLASWQPISHGICRRCARLAVGDDVWDLWTDTGGEG